MSAVEIERAIDVPVSPVARFRTGAGAVDVIALCDEYWRLAQRIANTEFVPKDLRRRPEAVLAALLSGAERGLGPMESLRSVHVIEGRPSLSAEAMRALVFANGHEIEIVETNAQRASVIGRRAGSEQTSPAFIWTIDRAKRAHLDRKDTWVKYPEAMLLARATADLCRALFPDVIAGLAMTEEVTDELAPAPALATATAPTRRRGPAVAPVSPPVASLEATATDTPPPDVDEPSATTATAATAPINTTAAEAPRSHRAERAEMETASADLVDESATGTQAGEVSGRFAGSNPTPPRHPDVDEIPGDATPWATVVAPDELPPDPGLARRIHAELAQALPDIATADRDRIRHALVVMVTRRNPDGPVTSSADLTLDEQIELTKIIGEIRAGRAQAAIGPDAIELRSHGWRYDITLEPPAVRTTRSQADETTGDDEQLDEQMRLDGG